MNLVFNNPFRVLGLSVSASEREIAKRISDLAIHAEMGTTPRYPTDFPVLSEMSRDAMAIKDASNRIEHPESKLYYSQFWFWNSNDADAEAFDALRQGSVNGALSQWSQTFEGGRVSRKNFSNMRNLAVLLLATAGKNGEFNKEYLTKGIILSGKIFDSTYFYEYATHVVGDTISVDREAIIRSWVEEVLQSYKAVIDTGGGISTKEILECFKNFPEGVHQYATDKFVFKPFQRIEEAIGLAGERRSENTKRSKFFGVELYNNVRDDLQYLKLILGQDSIRYESIADRLANEILQCAIDYFNESIEHNDEMKAADDAIKLAQMAKAIAAGERVKSRIDENIALVNKWSTEQTNKERIAIVQDEVDTVLDYVRDLPFIKGLSYYERIRLPKIAEEFVDNCYVQLQAIHEALGKDDSYYIQLCTLVASNAIGMCVLYVNTTDDPRGVSKIMEKIDQLDMERPLRERFNKNRTKLERIMTRRGLNQ